MSEKLEKTLLIGAVIGLLISASILYVFGVESLPNPDLGRYIAESVLYISGLVCLRGIWKQTLDKKISSKKRKNEH